jgi:gamma-glutamyl-gamma-aminobutyrate hydrolase PuuD
MSKRLICGVTGPSIFQPEIKKMVENYFNAVYLPLESDRQEDLEQLLPMCNFIVGSGGTDLWVGTYGGLPLKGESLTKFDIRRDRREVFILKYAVKNNLPLLGICRFFQLAMSQFGFTFIQDLWGNCFHGGGDIKLDYENGEFNHYVDFEPDFRQEYGARSLPSNSHHHQGILFSQKNLQNKFIKVVATARLSTSDEDKTRIVEIAEGIDRPLLLVQNHPEETYLYGDVLANKILEKFKKMIG